MEKQLKTTTLALPANGISSYFTWVNQIPLLTAEEEFQLATSFREHADLEAAKKLIMAHLRFVVKIAKQYAGYGLAQADLVQEGNIGLMKAVKRFDPKIGVRLVSFAIHWIKAEIHEFILRNWRIVKVATTKAQRKLFFNLRRLSDRVGWLSNKEVDTISKDLQVPAREVRTMESRLNNPDEPLDVIPSDEDDFHRSLIDSLEDHRYSPEAMVEQHDSTKNREEILNAALTILDKRTLDILQKRWLTEEKATLQELAIEYNISIERVRQLEKQAMTKLKKLLDNNK